MKNYHFKGTKKLRPKYEINKNQISTCKMNEKIVQSNTRILQTAIQKATERYLLDYSFISLYYSVFPFALFLLLCKTDK